MLQAELYYTYYIWRLAIIQSLRYFIYNKYYKLKLEYVYSKYSGIEPTDILIPLAIKKLILAPYCITGVCYTIKAGNICESISNTTGISSAALYIGN